MSGSINKILDSHEQPVLITAPPKASYNKHNIPDQKNFIAVDLETTGLSPQYNEIIEIGAIKYINATPVAKFNRLVKPQKYIPSRITKLTGISNKMVANAPPIEVVLPQFLQFIERYHLVIHNAPFDMGFLLANTRAKITNPVIDTVQACRRYFNFPDNKLKTVCSELKIINKTHHRALNDCYAVGQVYLACNRIFEMEKRTSLAERR
jgi:DNA polymerase III epsilon subunit family exonuclease